jgi:ribonuclease PH
MNVVVTGRGLFVEVQGTAEAEPFDRDELNRLLEMALNANKQLAEVQRSALGDTLEVR